MTTEHDWNLILRSDGDDPVAPSVMPLLDRTLDKDSTLAKFWDAMETYFRRVGYNVDSRSMAYKASADCDLAVMNLIATHYGTGIDHQALTTLFGYGYDSKTIRRFIILHLTIKDSLTAMGNGRSGAFLTVANAKSRHYRRYDFDTEEGYSGQIALAEFTVRIMDEGSRFLKYKLFTTDQNARTPWYCDEGIVELVMSHPEDANRIADIVLERKSIDAGMVREVLTTHADALSSGVL